MKEAQQARINKTLDRVFNYTDFGVMSCRKFIERIKELNGTCFEIKVRQEQKEETEREALNRLRNHIPSGNECHPETIEYNNRLAALNNGFYKTEYRAQLPTKDSRIVITKIEFDYFNTL